ncbi:MAG: hypothetical protein NZ827_03685, partial [Aquificaceae bacterium]|nr:hypothetical protein [Aquificaceae bacterium]
MKFTEEELKERVYKNHEFLSRKAPAILQTISSCQTPFSIKVDEEGRVDADLGGGLIYGGDAYEASLAQVKAFEEKPVRLFPDMQVHKKDIDGEVIANRYADKLLRRVEDSIELKPLRETGYMPLLLMVGLGFGFHLKTLLEKYEVQNLVILDVPAFFRLSIYTLDWEWLLNYYSVPGRRLEMIVQDKLIMENYLDNAFSDLLRVAQHLNPGVFYWGYYFEHLRYNPPMKVMEWFTSSPAFQELFHGYFDDELWSLHWTLEKFEK